VAGAGVGETGVGPVPVVTWGTTPDWEDKSGPSRLARMPMIPPTIARMAL
jgi:hypothetical protein